MDHNCNNNPGCLGMIGIIVLIAMFFLMIASNSRRITQIENSQCLPTLTSKIKEDIFNN